MHSDSPRRLSATKEKMKLTYEDIQRAERMAEVVCRRASECTARVARLSEQLNNYKETPSLYTMLEKDLEAAKMEAEKAEAHAKRELQRVAMMNSIRSLAHQMNKIFDELVTFDATLDDNTFTGPPSGPYPIEGPLHGPPLHGPPYGPLHGPEEGSDSTAPTRSS